MSLPLVYVIGDSISIQYGPYLEQYLHGRFRYERKSGVSEALLNLDVPQGANGGDSRMVLAYLRERVQDPLWKPDYLLINCGLHDIKTAPATGQTQVDIDAYRQHLMSICRLCRDAKLRMLWVTTTPVDDAQHNERSGASFHRYARDLQRYNNVADEVMQHFEVRVLDLHQFTLRLGGTEVFCDHVHYTEPVRRLQAAWISGFLDALVAEDSQHKAV